MSWKQRNRKTLLDTKFVKVFEDSVELPDGTIIDDFTVIQKPNYVMVIATDRHDNLLTIQEYKYAVNDVVNTFPAGHIDSGEEPLEAAKRELLEETGYAQGEWEHLGEYYDYASKDCHRAYFIRAKNVEKITEASLEITESLSVRILSLATIKEEIKKGKWKANVTLAALVVAGLVS